MNKIIITTENKLSKKAILVEERFQRKDPIDFFVELTKRSRSDIRRVLRSGGLYVGGTRLVNEEALTLHQNDIVQIGKKYIKVHFCQLFNRYTKGDETLLEQVSCEEHK